MRKKHRIQRALTETWLDLPYAKELEAIDDLLAAQPTIGALAAQDLVGGNSETGRPGMTGEEVIRALVLKQANQWSYSELWFQLHDSQTSRAFMGYGIADRIPSRSALAANIKKLRADTLESIGRLVLDMAHEAGVEKGRKIRVDTTPVESNIHHPFESDQLWDVVRVLTRLMKQAKELTADSLTITFADRTRRAKRRYRGAWNAKTKVARREQYRDLLKVAREVMGAARDVAQSLKGFGAPSSVSPVLKKRGILAFLRAFCGTMTSVRWMPPVSVDRSNLRTERVISEKTDRASAAETAEFRAMPFTAGSVRPSS
jgi:IS5 family transposase